MDWATIIVAFISALTGGGLLKLLTLKESRRAKKLENEKTKNEIEDSKKDEVINDWKELADQWYRYLTEERKASAAKDIKLDEKDNEISELSKKNTALEVEVTRLQLTKCIKLNCPDRKPPFGYQEVYIDKSNKISEDINIENLDT